jgi:hypothetical protein
LTDVTSRDRLTTVRASLERVARRQCKGTNRFGEPCGAAPLTDRDYCSAHDPVLPVSTRFQGGAKPGGGRPPKPRVTDIMRQRVEENADKILAPYFRVS